MQSNLNNNASHLENVFLFQKKPLQINVETLSSLLEEFPFEICESSSDIIGVSSDVTSRFSQFKAIEKCNIILSTSQEDLPIPGESFEGFAFPIYEPEEKPTPSSIPINLSVLLEVKKNPISVKAGGEAGSRGNGFDVGFSHHNILGGLETLQFHYKGSPYSNYQDLALTLDKPVFSHEFFTQLHASIRGYQDDYSKRSSYKQQTLDISSSFDSYLNHSLAYKLSFRNIILDEDVDSEICKDGGQNLKSSLIHTWKYDTRDDTIHPTQGNLLDISHEFAGIGGDVFFVKQQLDYQYHYPLNKSGTSLCFFNRMGLLVPLRNKKTSVCDRFVLGGPVPLRGFEKHTVGPTHNDDIIGGELFYSQGFHVNLPIPKTGNILKWHLFCNWGSNSLLDLNRLFGMGRDLLGSTRVSAGIGLIWASPIGRIEFNFCKVMRKEESDYERTWDFGVSASYNK